MPLLTLAQPGTPLTSFNIGLVSYRGPFFTYNRHYTAVVASTGEQAFKGKDQIPDDPGNALHTPDSCQQPCLYLPIPWMLPCIRHTSHELTLVGLDTQALLRSNFV